MRLIDADKLHPDRMTNKGTVAISQSQIANAETIRAIPVSTVEEIKDNWSIDRVFTSQMDEEMRTVLVHGWHKAVKCALLWGED